MGYRNDEFIKDPDILFIGDSFILGTGLTQDSTITNQLQTYFEDQTIYNLAPSKISQFDFYIRTGILNKPKVLIYSCVERNVPPKLNLNTSSKFSEEKHTVKQVLNELNLSVILDRSLRFYSVRWLRARLDGDHGSGVAGIDSTMFFLNGKNQTYGETELLETFNNVVLYKNYCDSLDIRFIYLPIPNKETVYYNLVPLAKQPDYLFTLDSLLCDANVETVNPLSEFTRYSEESGKLIYHSDDTHWNSKGVSLVAQLLHKKITTIDLTD
jgi:hypothetical protein